MLEIFSCEAEMHSEVPGDESHTDAYINPKHEGIQGRDREV